MDSEVWWWVVVAVVLGLAEIVNFSFIMLFLPAVPPGFLLPLAVGAAVVAVFAWFEMAIAAQWVVFLVMSLTALFGFRRFVFPRFEQWFESHMEKQYLD